MGFKRTSEGRIFFSNQEEEGAREGTASNKTANGRDDNFESPLDLGRPLTGKPSGKAPASKAPLKSPQAANAPQTQMQIIALLKTLNERLKVTQAERNKMASELEVTRSMVEALQKQSSAKGGSVGNAHAESLAREALKEVEEARHALAQLETKAARADTGVATLKKLQAEQAEKMAVSINHAAALTKRIKNTEEWQEQSTARIEDALSGQARLNRRLDKAIEERTRFMRKLERIEETVLETREAMNAKAMVLLTDQQAAAQNGEAIDDFTPGAQAHPHAAPTLNENQNRVLQIAGVGLLLIAALLGGYLINAYQKSGDDFTQADLAAAYQAQIEAQNNTAQTSLSDAPKIEDGWSIERNTAAFNETSSAAVSESVIETPLSANDDIGTLNLNDQAQVEALLDGNPDALAQTLNDIEPGTAYPENVVVAEASPVQSIQTPPPEEAQIEPAAGTTTQAPTAIAEPAPIKPSTSLNAIKPDTNLPEVVKNIEAQAFEGVPEAQHDLAAIYTAGHGGVKQNYERAGLWFEQAAANGVANAAYNLGVLNHQGLGVKADLETAINWYTRAAALGHPEAQYNLGIAYIEGIGVPYNAEKAATYFESAAKNNITEAAYNLGLIYENGLLGEAEPDKALVWYKSASDKGSPEAREALEQLAKSLGVSVKDVNSLAESMKDKEASAAQIQPATGNATTSVSTASQSQQIVTAQVQEYLMRIGLYPGPADGVTGPLTQDAIRSYQRVNNLNADGLASENLLSHMLANADNTTLNQ